MYEGLQRRFLPAEDVQNILLHVFSILGFQLFGVRGLVLLNNGFQDGKVCIHSAVNTSPGTTEVIVYAALYLKHRRKKELLEDNPEIYASRIADILHSEKSGKIGRDSCIQLDLRYLIFMKHLHVRIKLDCPDYEKAENAKDIILKDSKVEVNAPL
ncbi:hypothetical protein CerSpe_289020 [Prunus speciosa]